MEALMAGQFLADLSQHHAPLRFRSGSRGGGDVRPNMNLFKFQHHYFRIGSETQRRSPGADAAGGEDLHAADAA